MVLLLRNSFRLRLNEVKQSDFASSKSSLRTRKNIFLGVKRRFVASEGGFGCFGLFLGVLRWFQVFLAVIGCIGMEELQCGNVRAG